MFDLHRFLIGTSTLVFFPTTIYIIVVLAKTRGRKKEEGTKHGISTYIAVYLLGLITTAAWLSWNPDHAIQKTLEIGPPVDFPKLQVAGFISFALIDIVFTAWKSAPNKVDIYVSAAMLAAGFATAFSLADSFGIASQGGFGSIGSLIVICPVTVLAGAIATRFKHVRS